MRKRGRKVDGRDGNFKRINKRRKKKKGAVDVNGGSRRRVRK